MIHEAGPLRRLPSRDLYDKLYGDEAMWSVFDSADPEGITEHRFDSRLLGQLLGGISSCGFILDLACGRRLRPPLHSSRILSVDWALEALSTIPRAIAADMHLLPISSDSIDGVVSESGLYLAADLTLCPWRSGACSCFRRKATSVGDLAHGSCTVPCRRSVGESACERADHRRFARQDKLLGSTNDGTT